MNCMILVPFWSRSRQRVQSTRHMIGEAPFPGEGGRPDASCSEQLPRISQEPVVIRSPVAGLMRVKEGAAQRQDHRW